MRAAPLILAFALAGCAARPPAGRVVEEPVARACAEPATPVVVAPPPPVWPDSCVADWYAKASLPPCVEAYLKQLKTQQKTIARKRKDAAR